jgi:hypothetical protein
VEVAWTLCIAAECTLGQKRRVVMACDYETENEMVGAEVQKKMMRLSNSHIALIAGTLSRAIEMCVVCQEFFASEKGLQLDTLDKLRESVTVQKKRLADELVSGQLGMSYEDFLNSGKQKLPDDLLREIAYEVKHLTLDCSILVVQLSGGVSRLFKIHPSGMVEICCNFAAVGTGMWLAELMLFFREHDEDVHLKLGMYHVYEAMRFGSRAPGVGTMASYMVAAEVNGRVEVKHTTREYDRYLEKTSE